MGRGRRNDRRSDAGNAPPDGAAGRARSGRTCLGLGQRDMCRRRNEMRDEIADQAVTLAGLNRCVGVAIMNRTGPTGAESACVWKCRRGRGIEFRRTCRADRGDAARRQGWRRDTKPSGIERRQPHVRRDVASAPSQSPIDCRLVRITDRIAPSITPLFPKLQRQFVSPLQLFFPNTA